MHRERTVRPMNATVFDDNLRALGMSPTLSEAPRADRVRVTGEPPEVQVRLGSGWVRLHSRRDPQQEARRWLEQQGGGRSPTLLVVIGAGLGYVLDVLEEDGIRCPVVVFEPFPELARLMLARRDWRGWIASRRLTLIAGPDFGGASALARALGPACGEATVLAHPVLSRACPDETRRAARRWEQVVFEARANAEARRLNAGTYLCNTLRNLPRLLESSDAAALFDRFVRIPAIVVAAGPSLDDALRAIGEGWTRSLVIAVDTATRPLLAAGIAPDLVVSIDPTAPNGRHLAGLPVLPHTRVVAEASVTPESLAPFEGRTSLFSFGFDPWPWLRELGVSFGPLAAWGSVATTALDLAIRMGCDPILFAGLDLAFTGDRPYCRNTVLEADWARASAHGGSLEDLWRRSIARWTLVREAGIDGRPATTAGHLVAFRDWIVERAAKEPGRTFVNTSAGILHGGPIAHRPLADVVRALAPVDLSDRRRLLAEPSARHPSAGAVARALRSLAARLETASDAPGGPLASWRAFAGAAAAAESLTPVVAEALEELERAQDRPDLDAPAEPRPRAPFGTYLAAGTGLPERAAAIRAVLGGAGVRELDGPPRPEIDGGAVPAIVESLDRLERVLHEPGIVAEEHAVAEIVDRRLDLVPASWRYLWRGRAAHHVATIEARLGAAAGGAAVAAGAGSYWTHPIEPVSAAAGDAGDVPSDTGDGGARFALARQVALLILAATRGRPDGSDIPSRRLAARVLLALHPAGTRPAAGAVPSARAVIALGRSGRRGDRRAAVGLTAVFPALGRALTGAIAPRPITRAIVELDVRLDAPTRREPPVTAGVRLPSSRVSWIEPVALTDQGVPRCLIASGRSATTAVLSPIGGSESLDVRADGRITPGRAWPSPILGEVPWGGSGGAVAWHNDPPVVMTREAPDAPVVVMDGLPFQPNRVLAAPSGSILAAGYDGGLWECDRDGSWQRVAATEPVFAMHRVGRSVRLDPIARDGSGATRRALVGHAYLWDADARRLRRLAVGPSGPCWSRACRSGWVASAHPQHDLVALEHPSGARWYVTCAFPVTLAWAGGSLVVVSTTGGHVLLFRDLISTLESLRRPITTR